MIQEEYRQFPPEFPRQDPYSIAFFYDCICGTFNHNYEENRTGTISIVSNGTTLGIAFDAVCDGCGQDIRFRTFVDQAQISGPDKYGCLTFVFHTDELVTNPTGIEPASLVNLEFWFEDA